MRANRPTVSDIEAKNAAFMQASPDNDNTPSLRGVIHELGESVKAHQHALDELQALMLARGLITQESLDRARREMEAPRG